MSSRYEFQIHYTDEKDKKRHEYKTNLAKEELTREDLFVNDKNRGMKANTPIVVGKYRFVTIAKIKSPNFDIFIRRTSDDHIAVLEG